MIKWARSKSDDFWYEVSVGAGCILLILFLIGIVIAAA